MIFSWFSEKSPAYPSVPPPREEGGRAGAGAQNRKSEKWLTKIKIWDFHLKMSIQIRGRVGRWFFSGKSKISSPKGKLSKYELISSPNGKVRSVWKYGSKMIKILDLVELGGLIWASWDWILHRFWTIWPCSGPLARFGGPLRPQNHKRDVYRAFLRDLWQRERVWVSLWGQLRKIWIYEMKPLTYRSWPNRKPSWNPKAAVWSKYWVLRLLVSPISLYGGCTRSSTVVDYSAARVAVFWNQWASGWSKTPNI